MCFIKKGSQPVEEVTFSAVVNRFGRKWDSVKRLDVVVPSLSADLYPLCLATNGNTCAFGVEQR